MVKRSFIVMGCLVVIMGCATISKNNIDLNNPLHQEIQAFFSKPFSLAWYTEDAQIQRPAKWVSTNIKDSDIKGIRAYSFEEFRDLQAIKIKYFQQVNYTADPPDLINVTSIPGGVRAIRSVVQSYVISGKRSTEKVYLATDMVKINSEWKIKYERLLHIEKL